MKKKICFYIDTFVVGGIEKILLQYLKNIDKEKFETTLLIGIKLDELEKLKSEIPSEIKVEYILKDNLSCKLKKKKSLGKLKFIEKVLYEALAFQRKILFFKILKEKIKKFDIIIDFDMTLARYAHKISKKIITFCHFSPKNYHRGIKSRQQKHGKRLNDYDKVIMISDDMKEEAIEMYPFLENKLLRLYNFLNISSIQELSKERVLDERIKEKFILSIGRLEETQKDFTTLIKAYAKIKDKIEEKLFIIGDGRHKNLLENLTKDLKIEDKVIFLGFQKNPYPWIENSDLFVHSSKFEGLPTVLIEALALNKLIVATDCPTGPREILNFGKNGRLTKLQDADDLADGIKEVLEDKELQKKYLEESKERIKEFDSRYVMKKFENILENL